VLAGFAALHAGWLLAGAGVVAVARSADLLPLATLAAGGMLLHVLTLALFGSLACIAADAGARGAGSQVLDRLGGLATGMKITGLGVLVAGWSMAFLPPSAGFASGWMLLQALFIATRLGGLALHVVVAVTTLALIASAALAVASMVRLGATAFLGRPRTPRAAASEDASRPERITLLALSGLTVAAGLFPGLLVRLANPAQQWLTRAQMEGQAGWAGVQTQQAAPGYVPLAVPLLVAAVVAGLFAWRRRLPGTQVVALWQDGVAAPPAWMPFGDPATQTTPAGLALLLPRRSLPLSWPRLRIRLEAEWPALPSGAGPALLLALAVVLLLAVLLFGPP
jgi:formate hydrogenlyase subunit 3/multisubunit Na+/H+ antiporter MnhD subunit